MSSVEVLAAQPAVWCAVFLGTVLALIFVQLLVWKQQDKNNAAVVPGLPLIGNALALGCHGVSYINKCRRQFGDSFSLSLAGVKMTFLFEPSHIDYFFSAPDEKITFRPAVEQFTQRVFGLTSRLFFPLHSKVLTELRHLLVPGALAEHMQSLGARALQLLPCYVHHAQVDLYSLCRGLIFHCNVEAVFGRRFVDQLPHLLKGEKGQAAAEEVQEQEQQKQQQQQATAGGPPGAAAASFMWGGAAFGGLSDGQKHRVVPRPPAGIEQLARTFFTFEECFEMAASPLPHAFQPEFVESRAALLRVFRTADREGLFKGTLAGELLHRTTGLPERLRANLLLALIWASQANTVPGAFWSTAFLLLPENAGYKAAVVSELQLELQTTMLSPGAPEAASAASSGGPSDDNGVGEGGGSSSSRPPSSSPRAQPSSSELVSAATRVAARRRSTVSRCVAEALRLRVQSIDVRQVACPLDLPSESRPGGRLRLPRGRLLAVCPFESHHDQRLCGAGETSGAADPWVFDPFRPEVRLGDGSAVLPSVAGLAFGGGPYRCPGRFFAEQEIGLLVQLLLWSFDMTLSYGDAASQMDRLAAMHPARPANVAAPGLGQMEAVRPPVSASSAAPVSDLQPQQLRAAQGGSLLYGAMATLLGPSALAWGFGWFDGLDGLMQEWRQSGDPAGLLPPCDLRRLVGVKVPRKPCWVQLGRPGRGSIVQQMVA